MKRIEWLSGDRVIPTCGEVTTNSIIDLPDHLAESYIRQGEAKEVKPVKRVATREGESQ